ncbi:PBECR2 nuclease fold domain-containing protein, partial [Helicobacter sp. 13S00401-1]|uniref:PBECR2 nuclease fold domain-containing protein n=1 Tax=Helicobacter sp. 13S00401-1 TaxID=1905758 RepID=UPI00209C35E2
KIYQSPNFGTNSPQKAFTDITSSTNKTDIQENSTKATKTSQEASNLGENTANAIDDKDLKPLNFLDKNGKDHTISPEVQKEWIETLGLKSIDDTYIPKLKEEVKSALNNKDIKVQLGSLKKLVSQGRQKYIREIKEVLESPELIIKDNNNAYLFVKDIREDLFFINVSVNKGDYLVSISNGLKTASGLNNKLKEGGEVIYQSSNSQSNASKLSIGITTSSTNKTDIRGNPTKATKTSQEASSLGDEVDATKTSDVVTKKEEP